MAPVDGQPACRRDETPVRAKRIVGRSGSWGWIETGGLDRREFLDGRRSQYWGSSGACRFRSIPARQQGRRRGRLARRRAAVHFSAFGLLRGNLAVHCAGGHSARWSSRGICRRNSRQRQAERAEHRNQQPDHARKDRCQRRAVNEHGNPTLPFYADLDLAPQTTSPGCRSEKRRLRG